MRILLLGGTAEAGSIATALAAAGVDAVYSYAGRTASPKAQPLPTPHRRIRRRGRFSLLICAPSGSPICVDAIHPSPPGSAAMQWRPPRRRASISSRWSGGVDPCRGRSLDLVPSVEAAVAALPEARATIFLAIGRQSLTAFAAKPQHRYLLRLVDPMEVLPLPDAIAVVDRGPFTESGDRALMERRGVALVVAKNAGGAAAAAKLSAAPRSACRWS
ncbi:precorrin-6A/cobalt-precorrin-6A reductase [Methylosinus trichosporium]|uniref:precorrin-6A/cobalt-precorrin-6A reductase n=1 Tax=Methylosinus trichosporium TaxID=426 RepID=UPI001FCEB622|nr:precorrin-6A/cobalt-precorrin-6A reductase [Methylosinus trichosporium]